MTHTPGPWVAIPIAVRDNWKASKPIFPEGLWRILPEANVERCPIAEVDRADDHDLPTRLSAEADARLIAAAPDLLAALKDCETYFASLSAMTVDDAQDAMDTVRAAIARATTASKEG